MAVNQHVWPWLSQPQEVVEVDWANPLASGLLIAILPQLPVNLADGIALSAYGTRVVSGGARGMMNTSGGMLLPAPVNASDPSAKYDLSSGTALVVAVQSTETNNGVVFNRGRGSAEPLWAIGLHGGSFDGAFGSWGNSDHLGAFSGGPVPTVPRVATITADGATARVYLDGVEIESGAYTPGTPDYDTANLRRVIFGLNKLGANTNTNTFLALLWNRPLSAAEVKEVSGNPWQIFAPRSIWVPVSAGGGATDYPVTLSESTSAADTCSVLIGYASIASETGAAADTSSNVASLSATASESASATDTGSIVAALSATAPESASAVDSVHGTAAGDYAGTVTEAGSAADTSSNVAAFAGTVTETASVVDSSSQVAALTGTTTETGAAADSSSQVAALSGTASETATALDTVNGTATGDFAGTVTEAGSAVDTASNVAALSAATAEAASAADSLAAARAVSALIAEAMSAVDSVSASAAGDYYGTVDELSAAVDLVSQAAAFLAAVSESASAADQASAGGQIAGVVIELATALETIAAVTGNTVLGSLAGSLREAASGRPAARSTAGRPGATSSYRRS